MSKNVANTALKTSADFFRARLRDPALARMLDHWRALRARADGCVPPRHALDPAAVPTLLRHLQLHRREADGRFRCRLSGTAVVQQLGRDATGSYLDEAIRPEAVAGRMWIFNRALETGMPVAYSGVMLTAAGRYKAYQRLLLPLAGPDGRPAFVLSVMAFKTIGPMDAARLNEIDEIVEMRDEPAMAVPAGAVAHAA